MKVYISLTFQLYVNFHSTPSVNIPKNVNFSIIFSNSVHPSPACSNRNAFTVIKQTCVSRDVRPRICFPHQASLINELSLFRLKGQCHEIFITFLLLKRFDLCPMSTGKNGFVNFYTFAMIFEKNVSA